LKSGGWGSVLTARTICPHLHQDDLERGLFRPNSKRISHIFEALRRGMSIERIYELSGIDPWFLHNSSSWWIKAKRSGSRGFAGLDREYLFEVKQYGFSDVQLATLTGTSEDDIRQLRIERRVWSRPTSWWTPAPPSSSPTRPTIIPPMSRRTRPSGFPQENHDPRRRPQPDRPGIEFDYCCVHASFALREIGWSRSWSTPIPRPCPPITTPRTSSILNR
jgi:carbamoyl-phosphate synthase large subunit